MNLIVDNHERPVCQARINLSAIENNLSVLLKNFQTDGAAVCMLKANGYGHGAVKIAQFLEELGVRWFGVATIEEGIELRKGGVRGRILVMSGCAVQFFCSELLQYELTPMLSSIEEVQHLERVMPPDTKVHLDIDTGMSRGGFLPDQIDENFFAKLKLRVEGVSTHFSKAETTECEVSSKQLERFLAVLCRFQSAGIHPQFIHLDKSASILNQTSLPMRKQLAHIFPNAEFLMRCGLSLYGIDPRSSQDPSLIPALSWKAPIVLRKRIAAGEGVGYDNTFVASRETEIALVRVGYADGLKRQLSGRANLVVSGQRAPIVGRISMDLVTLDVTDLVMQGREEGCRVGQFAEIITPAKEFGQSALDLAKLCGTIPYEILTSISNRVERFYVKER